jgi:membrane protein implicated in regulation of membrane protease activity
MRIPLGPIAAVIVGIFLGLFLLPDFIFFPLIGVAAILTGMALFSTSIAWSIGLLVAGLVACAFGIKCMRDHRAAEDQEANRAEDEVRRRMGRIREDE